MKITDKRVEPKGISFGAIFPGQVFEWSHGLYMAMTSTEDSYGILVNAVNIATGTPAVFDNSTKVVPVEVELTVIANQ